MIAKAFLLMIAKAFLLMIAKAFLPLPALERPNQNIQNKLAMSSLYYK
jgi:hypothetical protein